MARNSMSVNLKGFEKLLDQIQEAGKDVNKAAEKAIKEEAKIYEEELKAEAKSRGIPDDIISEIKTELTAKNDTYTTKVGWKLGNYDTRKPSKGYKALFLNYGTVRRQTARGENRGSIPKGHEHYPKAEQFIYNAKKKARPKIKKSQQKILKKILGEVK